ncbi:MAG: hypothetical protein AAFR04_04210 [Pseudomonadota bacterium]
MAAQDKAQQAIVREGDQQTFMQNLTAWRRDATRYVFGRNALIGFASLMLLVISGYATWSGMSDFILGAKAGPNTGRAVGGVEVSNEWLVIAIVVALTFLMWLALRETFGAKRTFINRFITAPLYLFLALWSVGFGYGFWWSLIAGQEATRTSLANLQQDARDASGAVAARLAAVRVQLDAVVSWSEGQMGREESSGGSCGVRSGAGRGPLYNARRNVRDSIASLRNSVTTAWLEPVEKDIEQLRQSAAGLGGGDFNERQRIFETRAADIQSRAKSIAARSNELGRSTAAEMRALAAAVSVKPRQPGFRCFDPTLAQRLLQAASQAGEPAQLSLRKAVFNEGPAGVANAVKNLWANIGAQIETLFAWISSGFQRSIDPAATGGGLTGRDLIALLAALGIDLGLFALTALNPPPPARDSILERRIVEAINTAIARAPGANLEWVRKHFIFQMGSKSPRFLKKTRDRWDPRNSASYFVVPNLYSADESDQEEQQRAVAMNQLAGVLNDVGQVRALNAREAKFLREEEMRPSVTDLTAIRKDSAERLGKEGVLSDEEVAKYKDAQPVRNHGLFSKAERALAIAGWSDQARRDPEVYRVVDTDGLTTLLLVLNDGRGSAAPVTAAPAQETVKA